MQSDNHILPQITLVSYHEADHLNQLTSWLKDKKLMYGWGMNTFASSEEVNE